MVGPSVVKTCRNVEGVSHKFGKWQLGSMLLKTEVKEVVQILVMTRTWV